MLPLDILIQNAQLRHKANPVDIAISDGKIVQVSADIQSPPALKIDAAGSLVSPPFANPR